MTRFLSAAAVAATLFALSATSASAWYCRAESPNGDYGWARRDSMHRAREVAMRGCERGNSQWRLCRIVSCRP